MVRKQHSFPCQAYSLWMSANMLVPHFPVVSNGFKARDCERHSIWFTSISYSSSHSVSPCDLYSGICFFCVCLFVQVCHLAVLVRKQISYSLTVPVKLVNMSTFCMWDFLNGQFFWFHLWGCNEKKDLSDTFLPFIWLLLPAWKDKIMEDDLVNDHSRTWTVEPWHTSYDTYNVLLTD